MISVVIPLYNKEKQIGNTLRSVLNQTFQDFEIVVVNDGSTDNSAAEVERFHDQRIRLVHQANAGVSAARNRGIEESIYDLIAFLDADDEWKPSYLETQYSLYKKYPECSVFACNYEFRDADGNVRPTIIRKLPFQETDGILSNYFEVASCSHPPLWTSAIVAKKSALMYVGGFPVGIKSGEDLLTWARLATNNRIAYNKYALSTYFLYRINKNTPKRLPDTYDYVGKELKQLEHNHSTYSHSLKKYICVYYIGRCTHALECKMKKTAFDAACNALKYNPKNVKPYALFIFLFIPQSLRKRIWKIKNKF